jgi:hypothetical protein
MESSSASTTTIGPRFRPPDFLLPTAESTAARRRDGEPDIFVSWGGEVYGPAGPSEILAGIKASWFEPDATFWFEGQSTWQPLQDFPGIYQTAKPRISPTKDQESEPETNTPSATDRPRSSSRRKKHRGARHGTESKSPARWWIILGFVALGTLVTAGILLLLMLI